MKARARMVISAAAEATVTPIQGNVDLEAPSGCRSSVLLRQVDRIDGARYYVTWLTVGRYESDTMIVQYTHDGSDTLRVDVPKGTALTDDYLQAALADYWAKQPGHLPDDTVIIKK
jgi:hypothetical protein